MTVTLPTDRTAVFEPTRPRLFGIAYRMLGSVEDGEDLVQEAALRWQQAAVGAVREPEAWLVTVVTRLSIDRLRRARTEREAYVGQWLPERLPTALPGSRTSGSSSHPICRWRFWSCSSAWGRRSGQPCCCAKCWRCTAS
jgi:DNA-directed RNA polymerase specialized sigma24 family protein